MSYNTNFHLFQLRKQYDQYQYNLAIVQQQIAQYGGEVFAPLHLQNQLRSICDELERVAKEIQRLESPAPTPTPAPMHVESGQLRVITQKAGFIELFLIEQSNNWLLGVSNSTGSDITDLTIRLRPSPGLIVGHPVVSLPHVAARSHSPSYELAIRAKTFRITTGVVYRTAQGEIQRFDTTLEA